MADKSSPFESPPILAVVLIGIVMAFATVGWFGARSVMALIYGVLRAIQLPYFDQFLPYADRFAWGNLQRGMQPEFSSIYLNSIYYGLFTTALTLCVLCLALNRLSKNDIKPLVQVRSDLGRPYQDVLGKYALTEPSVRFFTDYELLDLPTHIGTGRQNHTAMELLFLTGALDGVVQNARDGRAAYLDIDAGMLKAWFLSRFGPVNPFYGMTNDKLADLDAIHAAVDDLGWAEALILHPAILRIHGYHVEENEDGFKATNALVDGVIADTWAEMNRLKALYGDAITLGFADEIDRDERVERHRGKGGKKRRLTQAERRAARKVEKDRKAQTIAVEKAIASAERSIDDLTTERTDLEAEAQSASVEARVAIAVKVEDLGQRIEVAVRDREEALAQLAKLAEADGSAFTSTRTVSTYEVVHLLGVAEREANEGRPRATFKRAALDPAEMVDFTKSSPRGGKGGKAKRPSELQFFGEVLSQYAEAGYLKSVETARAELKRLLTIHLTERTKKYPVRLGADHRTVYAARINDKEEQAFNYKAQLRLNEYAKAAEAILTTHAFQFGIVGGALTEARRSGIMPPNAFRWMRFCAETETLWWFVHNLGMPSAVPENAGLFEHYQMEVMAKSAITRPYVRQALVGVRQEAERYLTAEMIEEIKGVLGSTAVMDEMVKLGRLEQEAKDREAGRGRPGSARTILNEIIRDVEASSSDGSDRSSGSQGSGSEGAGSVRAKRPLPASPRDDDLDDMFD